MLCPFNAVRAQYLWSYHCLKFNHVCIQPFWGPCDGGSACEHQQCLSHEVDAHGWCSREAVHGPLGPMQSVATRPRSWHYGQRQQGPWLLLQHFQGEWQHGWCCDRSSASWQPWWWCPTWWIWWWRWMGPTSRTSSVGPSCASGTATVGPSSATDTVVAT